ncbi:SDR family NAD(P)-dependent oxidoreductase [Rhodobacteraceae bacterium KMM 6894]|nr:SDR family NAD(P)-dependent oxidoreductase [Rhodobacteraceae bacterium KMM 6894]
MTPSSQIDTAPTGRRRFNGKSVLTTGGAGGMGLAATRMFAAEGARVSVLDLNQQAGDAMVADMAAEGHDVFFQQADLSKGAEITKGIDAVLAQNGTIDVLFNHAGTIIVKPFIDMTEAEYDRLMDINVRSAFLVTQAVVRHMKDNGGGSIVVTSSIGAGKAFAYETLYCMTKSAVLMLSNAIAVEYRDHGIRCNAVCPGFVKTAHGLREIDELDGLGQEWQDADLAATQSRICEPEEVAAAVLFLASDEASFVNGTALYVDNGWFVKG